jgi:hypothetical protein
MRIAITGSTKGIGRALCDHFDQQGHEVLAFSRSQGYDISSSDHRQRIVAASMDCDVFINNAYCEKHNAQLELLKAVYHAWLGKDRRIINISSRITDWAPDPRETSIQYYDDKSQQDQFCMGKRRCPQIINLRPGMTDTERVQHVVRDKMRTDHVVDIVEFALASPVRISSITFGL